MLSSQRSPKMFRNKQVYIYFTTIYFKWLNNKKLNNLVRVFFFENFNWLNNKKTLQCSEWPGPVTARASNFWLMSSSLEFYIDWCFPLRSSILTDVFLSGVLYIGLQRLMLMQFPSRWPQYSWCQLIWGDKSDKSYINTWIVPIVSSGAWCQHSVPDKINA